MSFRQWVQNKLSGSVKPAALASGASRDDEKPESPRLPTSADFSFDKILKEAGPEADDAIDTISEHLGQRGLVKTVGGDSEDRGATTDASNYGVNRDSSLSNAMSNDAEEDDQLNSASLNKMHDLVKMTELELLKSKGYLDIVLDACRFSPSELVDIRSRLEDLAYDQEYQNEDPDVQDKHMAAYKVAKAECKVLILNQLYKRFQEVRRQETSAIGVEEENMDFSSGGEMTDDEEDVSVSVFLRNLCEDFQEAEDPLEPGKRRELFIDAGEFSPEDLLDIRERLQNLADYQIYKDAPDDLPSRDEDYAECKALIWEQLQMRFQESLKKEQVAKILASITVQQDMPLDEGHISWAAQRFEDHGSGEDIKSISGSVEADENDNAEIAKLRDLVHTAQTAEDFQPGKSLDEMVKECQFPIEESLTVEVKILELAVPKDSWNDDDRVAESFASRETKVSEFRDLVVNQLQRRLVEALKTRDAAPKADDEEPGSALDARSEDSLYSPDSPEESPEDLEEIRGVVGNARARGGSVVSRVWGMSSGSHEASVPESEPIPEPKPGELPLIMSLDGPVNIYQDPPSDEEQRIAAEEDQAHRMRVIGLHREIDQLKRHIRGQKQFYDEALRLQPIQRKPMRKEGYEICLKLLRRNTMDTILARCLVTSFLEDWEKLESHAAAALELAKETKDLASKRRCYYISGIALHHQEKWNQAYEAFSRAKDCPGPYKISNLNATKWLEIVSAALEVDGTPTTPTAVEEENGNDASVPLDPALPSDSAPRSRPRSEADILPSLRNADPERYDLEFLPLPRSPPTSDDTVRRASAPDVKSSLPPTASGWSTHHQRSSPIVGTSPFGSPSLRTPHSGRPLSFHSPSQSQRNAQVTAADGEIGRAGFTPLFQGQDDGVSPGRSPLPEQSSSNFSLGDPESPIAPEAGSPGDDSQRGRSVAFNNEIQAFSPPSSVAGSSHHPASSVGSASSIGSGQSTASTRSRRPALPPISIPSTPTRPAKAAALKFKKPAIPEPRPSRPIKSALKGSSSGSLLHSAGGSLRGTGEGSLQRTAIGNLRAFGDGSVPKSSIADSMLGNSSTPRSARTPGSAGFETDVFGNFGGVPSGPNANSEFSVRPQRRGGRQRQSSGSAQRNGWEAYRKSLAEEQAREEAEDNVGGRDRHSDGSVPRVVQGRGRRGGRRSAEEIDWERREREERRSSWRQEVKPTIMEQDEEEGKKGGKGEGRGGGGDKDEEGKGEGNEDIKDGGEDKDEKDMDEEGKGEGNEDIKDEGEEGESERDEDEGEDEKDKDKDKDKDEKGEGEKGEGEKGEGEKDGGEEDMGKNEGGEKDGAGKDGGIEEEGENEGIREGDGEIKKI